MPNPLSAPQVIVHVEESADGTLYDCAWVPSSARFVALGTTARGHGTLRTYAFTGSGVKQLSETSKPDPLKCCTFGASGLEERHVATGDFAGNLDIWDLESASRPVFSVKGHSEIINAIDGVGGSSVGGGGGAPELVTGSRDGTVKVWDPRVRDKPVACMQPREAETRRDCWSVAFGGDDGDDRFVAAGYDNGDVKLFDLRHMSPYWETHVANGVCSVQFDRRDARLNKLLATCLEGKFHVWDLREKRATPDDRPKDGFSCVTQVGVGGGGCGRGGESRGGTVWSGAHLPQNRDVFMTASGSGALDLWQYHYYGVGADGGDAASVERLGSGCAAAEQPVSGFHWSADKAGLAVCVAFDQKIRVVIVTKLNTL